jgi:pimeloyl-ACP methyl ester carboxylesterase
MNPNPDASPDDQRETVLFLHCSGSSARQWAPVTAALAAPIEAVPLDLAGYGPDAGDWPAGTPCTLDDEADRIAHWLQGPRPVHLVGHSFGATVALQLALRWPSRVRSLTLYEPVRFALLFARRMTRAIGDAIAGVGRKIGARVMAGRRAEAAEQFIDYWSGRGAWAAMSPGQQEAAAARMPKVRAEFEALFADPVPLAAYRRLTMPVLLLVGGATLTPPRAVARLLAGALPRVVRETLPGLGHMGPITHPARIAARLGAFLLAQRAGTACDANDRQLPDRAGADQGRVPGIPRTVLTGRA